MRESTRYDSQEPEDSRPGRVAEYRNPGFLPLHWLRERLFAREVVAAPEVPEARTTESRGQALRASYRALRALFAERPALRMAMPHLSHVERALGRKGSRALLKLPLLVMRRALGQLEVLQAAEPRDALRALRARLAEAIEERTSSRLAYNGPGVEVTEVSHSEYSEAERSWTGRVPLDFETPAWADTADH